MSALAPETGFRVRGRHVLIAVAGFFALVIGADLVFTVLAVRTFPGQVSVTPYEDGLLYNRALAQQEAQRRLGWRASANAEEGAVVLRFIDRDGLPVRGLTMSAKLERPATEAGRVLLDFRETEPGVYRARRPGLAGAWDLTALALGQDAQRFEARRRLTWP